ncbi:MAG: hypothetical protein A2074_07225 [Candidatus Aquicultor primus]|uniref:DUF433 domain-containing protein n=1 Tax=Candidatus Aquicultor primus TaxID=1797195 RepID=A0A1F2UQ31_9ACTN|nr:MAG: hypothetical protein A2074_07225 [Candidatus Aquicultor primus]HCG98668.1 hypothetical protein [Actinomycetota bacterium]
MKDFNRITFDPNIMGGQACIRGMRIPVSLIINLVASGMTAEDIIKEYPDLESEDIKEALRYASWLAKEELHPAIGAE